MVTNGRLLDRSHDTLNYVERNFNYFISNIALILYETLEFIIDNKNQLALITRTSQS